MTTATATKKGAPNTKGNSKGSMLFIHGMWGKGDQWADWQEKFGEAGWETMAPTLPLHDVSPSDPPPAGLGDTSLLDYADALEEQIKTLSDKPVIVGHSMGGIIAQILVSRGLAKAGIFLATAPPSGAPAVWELLMPSVGRTLTGKLLGAGIPKKPHRLSFKQAAYSCLNGLSPARQREEYDRWVHESGRALWELGFWYLDKRKATKIDPATITVPTLTVAAGRDKIVPARVVRSNAKRYRDRGGDFAVFQSMAHMLIIEEGWEEVADHCAAWMDDHVTVDAVAA